MNQHGFRPGSVVASIVLIGGVTVMILPGYVLSVLQVVVVAVAGVAGLQALALNVPPSGWLSPFKWLSPFGRKIRLGPRGDGPDEIRLIRSWLSARRQRLPYGPPLPPETLRLLRPLIRAAIDMGPDENEPPATARGRLSPQSWAILMTEPLDHPFWFQTLRPHGREVAEAVHGVLDELDHVTAGADAPHPLTTASRP